MRNSFNICQNFLLKGEYGDRIAKLMQVDIDRETRRFLLRFELSVNDEPYGQWVCGENAFHAMINAGDLVPLSDLPVIDLTGEHFDEDLFEV